MQRFLITVLSLGLAGSAACAGQSEVATSMEMGTADDTANPPDILPTWQAIVTPTMAEGTVAGEVTIRATEGGGTYTAIAIDHGESGHTYPWHIHSGGGCGSGGAIVGDPSAYAPIMVGADGEGEANATIAVDLDADTDYYVNVHQSPEDLATIVACGEVESQ